MIPWLQMPKPVRVPNDTHGDILRVPKKTRAVVVGGGIAGLAAAVVLAERGASVTLIERNSFLGGRAGAWTERMKSGETFEMERGFHAFFRQYYNLRALMRRVDPALACLTAVEDYPLLGPLGARESFRDLPTRAPHNLVSLVRRTPTLGLRDLLRVSKRRAVAMLAFENESTYARWDRVSAREYLDSLRFPEDARRMLFDVFSHSFFNPEEDFSAAELLMQFHFYFLGNPEGLLFDVMNRPFSKGLFEPLRSYLEEKRARIVLDASVSRIEPHPVGKGFRVHLEHEPVIEAELVVLALDVAGLHAILERSSSLGPEEWRASVARSRVTRPFAIWRLWLDRPCAEGRAPFVGTTGLGMLDNVSLYHLFEDESRAWAQRTGGSVIELHAYAVPTDATEAQIRADLLSTLHTLYPETKPARVLEERFFLRNDCPAFPPGESATRPTVETPIEGLALAGDFVRLPFPTALMERAASSGFLAANRLLDRYNVRGQVLWSVPPKGLLAS